MSMSLRVARANYRGDPGLGSFLGGLGRAIVGGAAGLVTGGPGGAIRGAIGAVRSGSSTPSRNVAVARQIAPGSLPMTQPSRVSGPNRGFQIPFPGPGNLRVDPGALAPGGRPAFVRQQGAILAPGTKLACPSGYRPNKTSYFLSDGTFVEEGTKCVKIRRRNPMNPRALDRAMSRLNSAKKVQSKLAEYSTGKYTAGGKRKEC